MAFKRSGVRLPLAPPIFKSQPFSVGCFFVLLPDPMNTRGTLIRFVDFDGPAANLTLAAWRSLREIPLSFLSGSKLPEVRRRHAFVLCKLTACALIEPSGF